MPPSGFSNQNEMLSKLFLELTTSRSLYGKRRGRECIYICDMYRQTRTYTRERGMTIRAIHISWNTALARNGPFHLTRYDRYVIVASSSREERERERFSLFPWHFIRRLGEMSAARPLSEKEKTEGEKKRER